MATQAQINAFRQNYTAAAQSVSAQTGIDWQVILAQWGLESGYGTSQVAQGGNLGGLETAALQDSGINASGGRFATFPTLQSFVNADAAYLNTKLYAGVRKAADQGASASTQAADIAAAGYDNGSPTPSYGTGIMNVLDTLFGGSVGSASIPTNTMTNPNVQLSNTTTPSQTLGQQIDAALNPSGGLLNLGGAISSTGLKVALVIGGVVIIAFGLWLLFRQPVESALSTYVAAPAKAKIKAALKG